MTPIEVVKLLCVEGSLGHRRRGRREVYLTAARRTPFLMWFGYRSTRVQPNIIIHFLISSHFLPDRIRLPLRHLRGVAYQPVLTCFFPRPRRNVLPQHFVDRVISCAAIRPSGERPASPAHSSPLYAALLAYGDCEDSLEWYHVWQPSIPL